MFVGNDWDLICEEEFNKPYFMALRAFLKEQYQTKIVYPASCDLFNAFKYTTYQDTKVVIIGQDPYHEPNQAHGLAFSVLDGVKLPPSLRNIYKEIASEFGYEMPISGDLSRWAKQGVLLLNNVLSVEHGKANSHKKKGWEVFTDFIISKLNERQEPVIFVFWGNNALAKKALVTNEHHYILTAPHPSPLSAYQGFFGCGHFIKINEILALNGKTVIDWH